jgi:hypothetical protein
MKLTTKQLADVLQNIRERILQGDSLEGNISYTALDKNLEQGELEVEGMYRTNNTCGQGGTCVIRRTTLAKKDPDSPTGHERAPKNPNEEAGGDEPAERIFNIPVYWAESAIMEIRAKTLDAAVQKANDADLPDGRYVPDSFRTAVDEMDDTEGQPAGDTATEEETK